MDTRRAVSLAAPIVERWERFRATPYICPAGFWTIGFGQLCKPDHPPITRDEAHAGVLARLPIVGEAVLALSPALLLDEPEHRLAALISFSDNLGIGRYQASTLRKKVAVRDWEGATAEFSRWVMGGGRKLPGLVARRADEAALFRGIMP